MLSLPPLPDAWPFEARKACGELKQIDSSFLPGLAGGWHIYVNSDISDLAAGMNLDGTFGRGCIIRAGGYILRPYRRGGILRFFNKDTYLTSNRFRNEYLVHASLWKVGYPTVEPVGYAFRRLSCGVEGVFITRWVDSRPWPRTWGSNDPSGQISEIARLIKSLSDWRLWAPDMNATNFIVETSGQVLALDWDMAKWTKQGSLISKYWARLKRSMIKLDAPEELIDSVRRRLIGGPA
ncbi:MAG: hypothetical protein FWG12_05855 [Holophagaceae bacterium]|nr:hypothetical protein [Holophagaceae bacterium]